MPNVAEQRWILLASYSIETAHEGTFQVPPVDGEELAPPADRHRSFIKAITTKVHVSAFGKL